jgi:hypothetical protein
MTVAFDSSVVCQSGYTAAWFTPLYDANRNYWYLAHTWATSGTGQYRHGTIRVSISGLGIPFDGEHRCDYGFLDPLLGVGGGLVTFIGEIESPYRVTVSFQKSERICEDIAIEVIGISGWTPYLHWSPTEALWVSYDSATDRYSTPAMPIGSGTCQAHILHLVEPDP